MVEHYHEFCGAVQLHGAGSQGDHGVDEGQVFVLQLLHVAHNVRLRLVPGRANTCGRGTGLCSPAASCSAQCSSQTGAWQSKYQTVNEPLKTSSQARIAKYAKICQSAGKEAIFE